MATAIIDAPAKINLTLQIGGKRVDGYHELRSLIMPVSLFDTVTVVERDDGRVNCEIQSDGIDIAPVASLKPGENLCEKAVRAMQSAIKRDAAHCGCDIKIVKRIPIGAGMGGGSADAAGVLHCLRALWAPDIAQQDWIRAGAAVGSDVPALMLGGAVKAQGRGEIVRKIFAPEEKIPPMWLVVAFGCTPASTREIFAAFDSSAKSPPLLTTTPDLCEHCARSVRNGDVEACARSLFNGLQDTVFRLIPETERFCLALRKGGAMGALLSGSGSAVFGLAKSRESAEAIRQSLRREIWSKVLRTLPDGVKAAHEPLVL